MSICLCFCLSNRPVTGVKTREVKCGWILAEYTPLLKKRIKKKKKQATLLRFWTVIFLSAKISCGLKESTLKHFRRISSIRAGKCRMCHLLAITNTRGQNLSFFPRLSLTWVKLLTEKSHLRWQGTYGGWEKKRIASISGIWYSLIIQEVFWMWGHFKESLFF